MRLFFILLYSLLFSYSSLSGARNPDYTYSTIVGSGFSFYYDGAIHTLNGGYNYIKINWGAGISLCIESPDQESCYSKNFTQTGPTYNLENWPASYGFNTIQMSATTGTSCPQPTYVLVDNACVPPPCPDDGIILPVDEGMCSGSMVVGDTTYSELFWQVCDSTCRSSNALDLTCEKVGARESASCNQYTHNFTFNCTEPPLSYTSSCDRKINPCDTEYNQKVPTCEASGASKWLSGFDECEHNGLQTTATNWQCLDNNQSAPETQSDCYNNWYEVWNPSTLNCDCQTDYVRNSFGDCSKPLPLDATPEEEQLYNEEQLDNSHAIDEEEQQDLKDEELQNSEDNQENTLSGLRQDNEEISDLLEKISDSIDGNTSSLNTSEFDDMDTLLADNQTFFDTWKNEYSTFYTNITTQYSDIDTQYNNAKNIFSAENVFIIDTGSTSQCLAFDFHGQTLNFDLCVSFSKFAPIVYFVITLLFMVGTFRFMVNHLLRGFE